MTDAPRPDLYAEFFRTRCLENPAYQERLDRIAAVEKSRAEELATMRALPHLLALGVPEILAKDVTQRPLFATQCLDFVMRPNRKTVTVLSGNPGCGKSLAGAALLSKIGDGWFVSAAELASIDRKKTADREAYSRALVAPCLVIDDLGTEIIRDEWLSTLDLLVDKRVGHGRATVITTNLAAQVNEDDARGGVRGFRTAYGPRIWSRLQGAGDYLESSDPDFRAARRAQETATP